MSILADSTKNVLAMITAQQAAHKDKQLVAHLSLGEAQPLNKPATAATQKNVEPNYERTAKTKSKKATEVDEFNEPYIAERITSDGRKTYRVQIRRRIDGKQYSLCQTFRHLKNAKTWRNKTLAEIELNGFPIQVVSEATIADVITDRLERGRELGRSAKQSLNFIKNHDFGETKVSTLNQKKLCGFAEKLLEEESLNSWMIQMFLLYRTSFLSWFFEQNPCVMRCTQYD